MKTRIALLVVFALVFVNGGRKVRSRHKQRLHRRFPKPETWMLYSSQYDPAVEERGCTDLRGPTCEHYANNPGYCHYQKSYMEKYCRKSCKWCVGNEDSNPIRSLTQPIYNGVSKKGGILNGGCEDLLEDCSKYIKSSTDCAVHSALTKKYCPRTCGHCCSDRIAECSLFIKHPSQCNNLNGFFKKYCAQTCKFCGPPLIPVKRPDCRDEMSECRSFIAEDCRVHERFTRKFCSKTCGYCEPIEAATRKPVIVKTSANTKSDFPLIPTESITLPPDADGNFSMTTAQPVTSTAEVITDSGEAPSTEYVTTANTECVTTSTTESVTTTVTESVTTSPTENVTTTTTESVTTSTTESVTTSATESVTTPTTEYATTTVRPISKYVKTSEDVTSPTESPTTTAAESVTSPATQDPIEVTTSKGATSSSTEVETSPSTQSVTDATDANEDGTTSSTAESAAEYLTSPSTERTETSPSTKSVPTTSLTEDATTPGSERAITESEATTPEIVTSPATESVQTTSFSEDATSSSAEYSTTAAESATSPATEDLQTTSSSEYVTTATDSATSVATETNPTTSATEDLTSTNTPYESATSVEYVTTDATEDTTMSSDDVTASTTDTTSPITEDATTLTTETSTTVTPTTNSATTVTEDVSVSSTASTVAQTDPLVTATETVTDASFKTNSPKNNSPVTVTHASESGKTVTHASESAKTVHVAQVTANPLTFPDTESSYGTAELVLGTPVTIPYVPEVTEAPSTLEATDDGNSGKTKCQQMQLSAKPILVGAFFPSCKENGEFEEKQCWGSTGYCWCVDKGGTEIPGTKVQFKNLNCNSEETTAATTTTITPSTDAVTEDTENASTAKITELKRQKDIPATLPTEKTQTKIRSTTKTRSVSGCEDRLKVCEKLVAKNANYCTNHVNYMMEYCRKSCKFCGPTVPIPKCRDKRKRKCKLYSKFQGYCTLYKEHMRKVCPKSCGFCGISPEEVEIKMSYFLHNMKYEFAIKTLWDGSPINHSPIKIKLSAEDSLNVRLEVSGPFFDQPGKPPCLAGQPCWKLWDYEVAEVFFLGEKQKYLELEVSPHGPHLLLLLDGVRKAFKTKLPMRYSATIDHNTKTWNGTAIVPIDYFPPNMRKINAYAIHGPQGRRVYESLYPAKNTPQPDFHQLQFFQDFNFKSMFPQGWKQPMSPFWVDRL